MLFSFCVFCVRSKKALNEFSTQRRIFGWRILDKIKHRIGCKKKHINKYAYDHMYVYLYIYHIYTASSWIQHDINVSTLYCLINMTEQKIHVAPVTKGAVLSLNKPSLPRKRHKIQGFPAILYSKKTYETKRPNNQEPTNKIQSRDIWTKLQTS